jgi:hypothetical protein
MTLVHRLVLACLCALLVTAAPAAARQRAYTFRAGPYTMGGYATQLIEERVDVPRVHGFVTRMHARLVGARGRTVHAGMLHHVFPHNLDVLRVVRHCTAHQPEVYVEYAVHTTTDPSRPDERGDLVDTRFDTPGRYRRFCYLDPMTMREQVTVLPRGAS